jgi:hypothetical protein
MATLQEKAIALNDGTLAQRFEMALGDFAQDTVTAVGTLVLTAEKRYNLCLKIQSDLNARTAYAKNFLAKALDKDEITVSPTPETATDAEINTSVSVNMFDDNYIDSFFRRFTF